MFVSAEVIAILGVGVTLLVAIVAGHAWQVTRLDGVRKDLDAKIDGKIDGLRGSLDAKIDGRIDGLRASLEAKIDGKIDGLRASLEAKIDQNTRELGEVKVAIGRLEGTRPRLLRER